MDVRNEVCYRVQQLRRQTGITLDMLSDQQVHYIMDRLNHRPRKGLAFQTPHEILCKETGTQPKQT